MLASCATHHPACLNLHNWLCLAAEEQEPPMDQQEQQQDEMESDEMAGK